MWTRWQGSLKAMRLLSHLMSHNTQISASIQLQSPTCNRSLGSVLYNQMVNAEPTMPQTPQFPLSMLSAHPHRRLQAPRPSNHQTMCVRCLSTLGCTSSRRMARTWDRLYFVPYKLVYTGMHVINGFSVWTVDIEWTILEVLVVSTFGDTKSWTARAPTSWYREVVLSAKRMSLWWQLRWPVYKNKEEWDTEGRMNSNSYYINISMSLRSFKKKV